MLKGTSTTSVFLDSLSQRMPAGNFLVSVAFPLFHFLHVFLLGHTFAPQWRGSRGRPLPVAGGGSPKLREKAIKNGSLFLWRNANHINRKLFGVSIPRNVFFYTLRFPETWHLLFSMTERRRAKCMLQGTRLSALRPFWEH